MHRTGKIKLIFMALLMLAALAAVGCGNKKHTHTFSEFWAYDSVQHWQPSACNHNIRRSVAEHGFTASVTMPDESSGGYTTYSCACGYSYIDDKVRPLPDENGQLRFNENGHWQLVLGENEQPEVIPHDFGHEAVAPTCTSYGYTKHTCKDCDYWVIDTPVEPVDHEVESDIWAHDDESHWKPCLLCGGKFESTTHVFAEHAVAPTCDTDGYTRFDCADCGYSYTGRMVEKHHTYSDEFAFDDYDHWLAPACGHADAPRSESEEHILIGKSNVCEICKKQVAARLGFELSADGSYYNVRDMGCITGTTVTIPSQYRNKPVKGILPNAFANENITSVTVPSGIAEIGANAFAGCTAITQLALPETLISIGTKAFEGTGITSLTLPASVESVSNGICANCTALQTVTINCALDAIPPYAFEGCENLTAVTASHNPTQVGALAFSGCKRLATFDISACTKIGFAAFDGCIAFAPAIPSALVELDEYAFGGCNIASATLPATLASVGNYAFDGCTSLTTVTVRCAEIGKYAFNGCTGLQSVTLVGTQRIYDYAFNGCAALSVLTLPDTVIEVGQTAFDGTALITTQDNLKIAAGVVIGTVDKNVTSITVPADVVGIADNALRDCTKLSSVTPGGVRFIGKSAFRNTSALSSITFSESVKYIGANAFRESGLTSVTIPATVDAVGDNAFYDCASLTSANISAKAIGKFAFSYTGVDRELNSPVKKRPASAHLVSVVLGDTVTTIGSNAFQYCPITHIALPSALTEIGKYAFAQTDIQSVTIPATVEYIGEYAFYETKLKSATLGQTQGWKAGQHAIGESAAANAAQVAALLTRPEYNDGYLDTDWIRE